MITLLPKNRVAKIYLVTSSLPRKQIMFNYRLKVRALLPLFLSSLRYIFVLSHSKIKIKTLGTSLETRSIIKFTPIKMDKFKKKKNTSSAL